MTLPESFLEELLSRFPEDFFPGRGFVLEGRQRTLPSGGRLDLTFRDSRGRLWVVEVKAVPVQVTVADQVVGYFEDLRKGEPNTIPAVVAPMINHTVRQMFDRAGIGYFEIHEGDFRRVALERGMAVPDIPVARREGDPGAMPQSRPRSGATAGEWKPVWRQLTPEERSKVDSLIQELVSYPDPSFYWQHFVVTFCRSLKEDLASNYAGLSRGTGKRVGGLDKLENWCHPKEWGSREQKVAPVARRLSMLLFNKVVERNPGECTCRACKELQGS